MEKLVSVILRNGSRFTGRLYPSPASQSHMYDVVEQLVGLGPQGGVVSGIKVGEIEFQESDVMARMYLIKESAFWVNYLQTYSDLDFGRKS